MSGRGEWALDSGSSFDILSKHDMEKEDKRKTYSLADPVYMHTADGEVTTDQGIVKKPFGDLLDIECLILPNSPSLLSLGRLCMESDLDFSWPRGQRPWLTFPDGSSTQLKVANRVPLWPMNYTGEAHEAGMACPSTEGGCSGSGEHLGDRCRQ